MAGSSTTTTAQTIANDVSAIDTVNSYFTAPVIAQSQALKDALDSLKTDSSNAAALAEYQGKLAQSTSIKVIKDLAMSIIGNMR